MIIRQKYLDILIAQKDRSDIKIITGMRRCGKSIILSLFRNYLLDDGVAAENIIIMDLELNEFANINNGHELYTQIKNKLSSKQKSYLFLDEIQLVKNWEEAVACLYKEGTTDIYLTSSNALPNCSTSTPLLNCKYVNINILPLSFQEYLQFVLWKRQKDQRQYNFLRRMPRSFMDQKENLILDCKNYLEFGGLPTVPFLPQENDIIQGFLEGVYNSIIIKNVLLTTDENINDIQTLKKIVRYTARSTGAPITSAAISCYLSSHYQKKIYNQDIITQYISLLEKAFILYRSTYFDIKNNVQLNIPSKYYLADSGIRNMLLSFADSSNLKNMETVIYFELLRRDYKVFCGKYDEQEIDFYATKTKEKICLQFIPFLKNKDIINKKITPLKILPSKYEKIIISMDEYYDTGDAKIKFLNFIDFLLSNDTQEPETKSQLF